VILVDTSVWIDHLRKGVPELARLLNAQTVMTHPFVIGELALGNLRQRAAILDALNDLPRSPVADHDEVLGFVHSNGLWGLGIGYVDVHLLAAVRLAPGSALWTRDKRLLAASSRLGLAVPPVH
jgi:predicted nucleic acid-binding protein